MRPLLLATLLLVLLAPPATAAEQVCKLTGPQAQAEQALQEQIRRRESYGFRGDRAYVASLIAQGAVLTEHGELVGTPEEARYLKRREALTLGAGATRYLRRHPAIAGWWEIRDDWPRRPYVAVFLTDDSAARRAAIRRLASYPTATRVVRVRYSDRVRDRISSRINRDQDRLEKAGLKVVNTETEPGTDRVDVFLVTRRTDHAAYFAKRYGKVTHTVVVSRDPTTLGCTRASSFTVAPDGLSLTVSWGDAPPKPERIELTETADGVAVGIVSRYGFGATFGDPGGTAVVRLGAPLGDRPVYDADNGSRLLQRGPSPGDAPCPEPVTVEQTPLERAILERERYGMNVDPAYVQALLDDDRTYTEHERRWLKSAERITYERDVDDYLQHWREDWGGTAVYTQYPDRPIVLIYLLRRQAVHERRLKALSKYPGQIRTVLSTTQRDFFYELPQTIGDDAGTAGGFLDGYGRAGFYVASAEGDDGAQSVDVKVITTRSDAAAYFTARYGPLVRVEVIGDRFECRESYR